MPSSGRANFRWTRTSWRHPSACSSRMSWRVCGPRSTNVKAVATAQVRDAVVTVDLPQGQSVEIVEHAVRRAAVYVPAGRAPYPSTVVMGAVTARVAGVAEVVVCAPPGPEGRAHPAILAACVLCGVTEVYRMGGAQAIAALAYGTRDGAAAST